jgi:hypothetical protein
VKGGKRALGRDGRRKVAVSAGRFDCSIDLDRSREAQEPNADRWDYVVVVGGIEDPYPAGIEVHPATAGEVTKVIAKQQWARQLLEVRCAGCRPAASRWYWVASGKVYLRPTDPQSRRLRRTGIQGPLTRLVLPPG